MIYTYVQVKRNVCLKINIKGQNYFVDASIIDHSGKVFCNWLYTINQEDENDAEEDHQRLRHIVFVNVLNLGKTLEKLFSGNESLNSLYLEGIKDFIL